MALLQTMCTTERLICVPQGAQVNRMVLLQTICSIGRLQSICTTWRLCVPLGDYVYHEELTPDSPVSHMMLLQTVLPGDNVYLSPSRLYPMGPQESADSPGSQLVADFRMSPFQ